MSITHYFQAAEEHRVTPTRQCRRYSNARLDRRQVEAAHELYWGQGLSLADLGRLLWDRFGYSSPRVCEEAIRRAFRRDGLAVRPLNEALVAGWEKRRQREALALTLEGE